MFENNRVEAESVADFLEKYYKKARYHGHGVEYAAGLLASHEKDFELYGYDIISHHDSVTGEVVAYFGSPAEPPADDPIYCYICRTSQPHVRDGNEEKCTVCGSHRAA